ncbi:hypothetical protein CDAR_193661 [Caerostris darwini]|uniref:Uncharacterized protein n=1 Tax=Caerostris darwini TaxID=1538125 RepID=A0AAV4UDD9_9ARAC|nr:hypothetical protein CDAR_193661 [Caerostris darwini]
MFYYSNRPCNSIISISVSRDSWKRVGFDRYLLWVSEAAHLFCFFRWGSSPRLLATARCVTASSLLHPRFVPIPRESGNVFLWTVPWHLFQFLVHSPVKLM